MTEKQRNRILAINAQIATLRAGLKEAMESGTMTAAMSTAGNSQSYSRMAPAEYRIEIARLMRAKQLIFSGGRSRRTSPDFG